jgi:hypothetical protein
MSYYYFGEGEFPGHSGVWGSRLLTAYYYYYLYKNKNFTTSYNNNNSYCYKKSYSVYIKYYSKQGEKIIKSWYW